MERRLQAALQGASTFNVSKLSYINPTMNDEKLLKVAGLFVQNRDVIKNIQGGQSFSWGCFTLEESPRSRSSFQLQQPRGHSLWSLCNCGMRCNQGETWLEFIFGHSLNKTLFVSLFGLFLDKNDCSLWTKLSFCFGGLITLFLWTKLSCWIKVD